MKFLSKLFGKPIDESSGQWTLTPFQAKIQAAVVVQSAAKLGVNLDYSPNSLVEVDMLIDKERQTGVGMTKEMAGVLLSLGAYAGQVMAMHLGGKWQKGIGTEQQDPLIILIDKKFAINVISTAFKRFLEGEPFSVARMFNETLKLKDAGKKN